jgi:hypothetical protein
MMLSRKQPINFIAAKNRSNEMYKVRFGGSKARGGLIGVDAL